MAKPTMKPEFMALEEEILVTFLAGHHVYRPDLAYPESHSDMHGGIRALLLKFDIKLRPLPLERADLLPKQSSRAEE